MATTQQSFVLCFGGTGNKFQGTAGDSSTGIGTYTTGKTLSSNGIVSRFSSWCHEAKHSAIGTILDEHIMAGYLFLMRYYQDGDDIYNFGFSRGAHIPRFLSELLDHVGLLSAGNKESIRFRRKKIFRFMESFCETFARPVRSIRFLGLFDTVISVSKVTARNICHVVSIDERWPKFRQDLISQKKEHCKIAEVCFPGCHAGIGGGWEPDEENFSLKHVPLVWVVCDAEKAGLVFNENKICDLEHYYEEAGAQKEEGKNFNVGETRGNFAPVTSMPIMEFLPFRRMDLRPDGSWKAI
ncbi:hypothetical protein BJ878DRAFT_535607 [Calycina marina]|uniref:T6SS Phospholipase effector Tle1-like catalytic domain-containing protein n=1 Tax=Calycina marina TaxID=1763456 RepID=A0A9P7Z030_9HELO|nr:hypothetical protein BJ878DRAFT_535607 [Calycina marina]